MTSATISTPIDLSAVRTGVAMRSLSAAPQITSSAARLVAVANANGSDPKPESGNAEQDEWTVSGPKRSATSPNSFSVVSVQRFAQVTLLPVVLVLALPLVRGHVGGLGRVGVGGLKVIGI